LVEEPEERRPLGRPRSKRMISIKMNLKEKGYEDKDWIRLAQEWDRWQPLANMVMNLPVQ
jgi:hypothetical protein